MKFGHVGINFILLEYGQGLSQAPYMESRACHPADWCQSVEEIGTASCYYLHEELFPLLKFPIRAVENLHLLLKGLHRLLP
jgi:hypothetical protein